MNRFCCSCGKAYVNEDKKAKRCEECQNDLQYKDKLYDYLTKGFSVKRLSGKTLNQIKYCREKGYKYEEIIYTVYFITNVKGKILTNDSIGIVDYYYDEAMSYLKLLKNRQNQKVDIDKEVLTINRRRKYTGLCNKEVDITSIS